MFLIALDFSEKSSCLASFTVNEKNNKERREEQQISQSVACSRRGYSLELKISQPTHQLLQGTHSRYPMLFLYLCQKRKKRCRNLLGHAALEEPWPSVVQTEQQCHVLPGT